MQHLSTQNKHIYSVAKLNRLARRILESEIGQVWISAEISNFVAASSGHWYFSLKDDKAQIRAAMFKNANRRASKQPKNGEKVLVRGSIGLYEPRGDYQLIVEHIEADGEGALKRAFEELKIKLAAQGLFSLEHKKALPDKIHRVGIVTSATGAALHDILTVLNRRSPTTEIFIYPTSVQGENAHLSIAHAIENANGRNEVDVLIVGRGGGSLEDLWCFNNEQLARTIFASKLPVVSAVGHEIDVSIADFVADVRAATPSAAAELVSMDQREWIEKTESLSLRLNRAIRLMLEHKNSFQGSVAKQLNLLHPQKMLEQQSQQLDRLQMSLQHCLTLTLTDANSKLVKQLGKLTQSSPRYQISQQKAYHQQLSERMRQAAESIIDEKGKFLANQSHLLDSISPLSTLSRGYSISFKGGQIVRSAKALNEGDQLTTKFVDGEVVSKIQ